jgi:variant SH3 domain-containing protein
LASETQPSQAAARVSKAYVAQYPDPIAIEPGDLVHVGKHDAEYPGWVWATSARTGKNGWVPEEFLTIDGANGQARRAYTAQELTVSVGETVTVVQELLGWAWVQADASRKGWVPVSHLAVSQDTGDDLNGPKAG